jgi:hypothetical protein
MPREKGIEGGQPGGRQPDEWPVPLRNRAPAAAPDPVARVVAQDRCRDGQRDDPREREETLMGQEACGQQDGFAWHRHSSVLEQDAQENDRIAVL